jgi:hypothetical protein
VTRRDKRIKIDRLQEVPSITTVMTLTANRKDGATDASADGHVDFRALHRVCKLPAVLLVAHLFHPLDVFAVEEFLNRDVRHARRRRRAMPVFLARRNPDDIPFADFLGRTASWLNPARASRDDQRLTQRVRVPCCARAGLERHAAAGGPGRSGRVEQRIGAYSAREVLGWSLPGKLRSASRDRDPLRRFT